MKARAYLAVPTSACSVHQHHDQKLMSSVLYTAVQILKTAMKACVNSKSTSSVNIPWRGTSAYLINRFCYHLAESLPDLEDLPVLERTCGPKHVRHHNWHRCRLGSVQNTAKNSNGMSTQETTPQIATSTITSPRLRANTISDSRHNKNAAKIPTDRSRYPYDRSVKRQHAYNMLF